MTLGDLSENDRFVSLGLAGLACQKSGVQLVNLRRWRMSLNPNFERFDWLCLLNTLKHVKTNYRSPDFQASCRQGHQECGTARGLMTLEGLKSRIRPSYFGLARCDDTKKTGFWESQPPTWRELGRPLDYIHGSQKRTCRHVKWGFIWGEDDLPQV